MSNNNDLKVKLYKEIEERVKVFEDPSYDYGEKFGKQDILGVIFVAIICVIGLVWGYL